MTLSESLLREAEKLEVQARRLRALASDAEPAVPLEPVASAEWVSDHFTIEELSATSTGLPNDPPPLVVAHLAELCRVILDPLRRALNRPVRVTSGYRSPAVNVAVGGSGKSQHLQGQAADVTVAGMTSEAISVVVLGLKLPVDQCIGYEDLPHLHLSHKPNPRGQWLYNRGGVYEKWR